MGLSLVTKPLERLELEAEREGTGQLSCHPVYTNVVADESSARS